MKKEIKKLELKRLFKEFGFLKIDEEYKFEIQISYGPEFEMAAHQIFKENPDLNLLFNNAAAPKNENSIQKENNRFIGIEIYDPNNADIEPGLELSSGQTEHKEHRENTGATEIKKPDISIDEEVKKLYRKIATKTHPDKVSVKYLNDLYMKAQTAYENNDIFTLYLICNDLDIEYEFSGEKLSEFKTRIKTIRSNNELIERTYLWAWAHEENEEIRKNILHHFITHAYRRKF